MLRSTIMLHALRFLPLLLLAALIQAQSSSGKVRDRFIGVWKLLSCEQRANSGEVSYPYGEHPVGRIIYDRAGRMSATLMRPGRAASSSREALRQLGREDLLEVIRGFTAYYGTFDVDESSHTVIHHVEAALYPGWVGTDLKRSYEFSGNQLILTAASANGALRLVWERQPD